MPFTVSLYVREETGVTVRLPDVGTDPILSIDADCAPKDDQINCVDCPAATLAGLALMEQRISPLCAFNANGISNAQTKTNAARFKNAIGPL